MNNIQYAYSYFISKGLSANAAAGIVGNLKAESNVDPNSNQQGGPGMGIAQWSEGGRWDVLLDWAGKRDPRDLDTQLDFLWHELQTGYRHVLNRLKNTNNLHEATAIFMTDFEIPADQSASAINYRVSLADDVRDNNKEIALNGQQAKGGGGGGGGGGNNGPTKADYGFAPEFLETHPAISDLVDKAINQEWSVTRFQQELKQTEWWQSHTAAQRDYQVKLVEDPAQAAEDLKTTKQQIRTLAQQMGVTLGDRELDKMAERATRNAYDSIEMQMMVGGKFEMGKGPQTGSAATITTQLKDMADQYALPIGRERLAKWTTDVLQGQQTVEGYDQLLAHQAKQLYPHLAQVINQPGGIKAWADPYLQSASQMLGVSTAEMNLRHGPYAKLLNPSQKGNPPTIDQWQNLIRNDEKFGWDKTSGAQEQAAGLTTQLAQMMGAM